VPSAQAATTQASLGESLFIKGEISGSEDLVVNGRFEGRINLKNHNLTIGPGGKIEAHLRGKNVAIEGKVHGDVVADEKVELAGSGRLQGDIKAPRFAMSEGTHFKGSVDPGEMTLDGPRPKD
jgi:cytoskeletal protein CcmA (bactofilin family)